MRNTRITLDIKWDDTETLDPSGWDWHDLLDMSAHETIAVVRSETRDTSIGIPYARIWIMATGEALRVCPVCGARCPIELDNEGETIVDAYPDHYASDHE